MFRFNAIEKLKSASDNIILWKGVIEDDNSGDWLVSDSIENNTVLFQWPTEGYEVIPSEKEEIQNVLHGLDQTVSPPLIIKLNATGITELNIGFSVLDDIVRPNGIPIRRDITSYIDSNEKTVIDLSSFEGWVTLYLYSAISYEAEIDETDDKITFPGIVDVYGIRRSDNTVQMCWEYIQYKDDQTIVKFPDGFEDTVSIFYSGIHKLAVHTDVNEESFYLPTEYPAEVLNNAGCRSRSFPIIANGQARYNMRNRSKTVYLLVPSWIYGQLLRSNIKNRISASKITVGRFIFKMWAKDIGFDYTRTPQVVLSENNKTVQSAIETLDLNSVPSRIFKVNIASGETKNIFNYFLSKNKSYELVVVYTKGNMTKKQHISCLFDPLSDTLNYNVYSILGSEINVEENLFNDNGFFRFDIENNESEIVQCQVKIETFEEL